MERGEKHKLVIKQNLLRILIKNTLDNKNIQAVGYTDLTVIKVYYIS